MVVHRRHEAGQLVLVAPQQRRGGWRGPPTRGAGRRPGRRARRAWWPARCSPRTCARAASPTERASSVTSRVLPEPASPPSSTTRRSPPSAWVQAWRSVAQASVRGHERELGLEAQHGGEGDVRPDRRVDRLVPGVPALGGRRFHAVDGTGAAGGHRPDREPAQPAGDPGDGASAATVAVATIWPSPPRRARWASASATS